ncbi:MAG: T9SS type A sorting domain-containing protein [Flavobacteriales bacterium]|nr:T9SS type A sorting domain-containing protein [Flavobacteriales bacterium]
MNLLQKNSKRLGSVFAVLFVLAGSFLYAQNLKWAYSFQNPSNVNEVTLGMSSNGDDRIVISGRGIYGLNLDARDQKSGHESDHAFIASYSTDAEMIWSISGVDPFSHKQHVVNVLMDSDDNVYSFGIYSGTLDFDPGPANSFNTASDLGSTFIQKFNKNGAFQWDVSLPVPAIPAKVAISPSGSIIISGKSSGDSSIVTRNGGVVKFTNGIFIVEISSEGEILNAGCGRSEFNTKVLDMAIDADGNIVLCGSIGGVADFDLGANEALDTSNRAIDAFVAKYDKDLKLLWQKRWGDISGAVPSWDFANGATILPNGKVLIGGSFTYTTDFAPDDEPGKWVFVAETRSQSPDGCLILYKQDGTIEWVKHLGAHPDRTGIIGDLDVLQVVHDESYIYCSGQLTGSGDFDPGSNDAILNTGAGNTAFFIGMYDHDGNYEQAFLIDDTSEVREGHGVERVYHLMTFDGSLYAYGTIQKEVDFDPGADEYILFTDPSGANYSGDNDLFFARWEMDSVETGGIYNKRVGAFTIYPNPADQYIQLQVAPGNYDVEIFDLQGVANLKLDGIKGTDRISTNALVPGVYILRIRHSGSNVWQTGRLFIRDK